jgi:hypothetical protein
VNVREDAEKTAVGRIAATVRSFVARFYHMHRFLPDYADLRDGIEHAVERELLVAELKGLQVTDEDQRRKRADEILKEILKAIGPKPKT